MFRYKTTKITRIRNGDQSTSTQYACNLTNIIIMKKIKQIKHLHINYLKKQTNNNLSNQHKNHSPNEN